MRTLLMLGVVLSVLMLSVLMLSGHAQTPAQTHPDIEAFNRSFADATRRMDNAATIALWADDGISLLPSTEAIVGKPAIAAFINRVTAQFPGARMESFDLACFAIEVSGAMASEWCTEHQVVRMAGDKPPFDGRGKMLLVLKRNADGQWRIEREMWNQAAPEGGTKAAAPA